MCFLAKLALGVAQESSQGNQRLCTCCLVSSYKFNLLFECAWRCRAEVCPSTHRPSPGLAVKTGTTSLQHALHSSHHVLYSSVHVRRLTLSSITSQVWIKRAFMVRVAVGGPGPMDYKLDLDTLLQIDDEERALSRCEVERPPGVPRTEREVLRIRWVLVLVGLCAFAWGPRFFM